MKLIVDMPTTRAEWVFLIVCAALLVAIGASFKTGVDELRGLYCAAPKGVEHGGEQQ